MGLNLCEICILTCGTIIGTYYFLKNRNRPVTHNTLQEQKLDTESDDIIVKCEIHGTHIHHQQDKLHSACKSHGHCFWPIECILFQDCPMHQNQQNMELALSIKRGHKRSTHNTSQEQKLNTVNNDLVFINCKIHAMHVHYLQKDKHYFQKDNQHSDCVSHGHCLWPVECILFQDCPVHRNQQGEDLAASIEKKIADVHTFKKK